MLYVVLKLPLVLLPPLLVFLSLLVVQLRERVVHVLLLLGVSMVLPIALPIPLVDKLFPVMLLLLVLLSVILVPLPELVLPVPMDLLMLRLEIWEPVYFTKIEM